MDITGNLSGTRVLVVGAGLALALAMGAAPTTALAEGRVGTTDVTIRTEIVIMLSRTMASSSSWIS